MYKVKGKATAIMPVYNRERYLTDAIESILNQNYENFNLIIVDDCSTDNSLKICRSYEEKYPNRITVVALEKNQGSGNARNVGIQKADGEFLIMTDSDDIQCSDKLSTCVAILDNEPEVDIVSCNAYKIDENGKVTDFTVQNYPDDFNDENKIFNIYLRRPVIATSACIFRNIPDVAFTSSSDILDDLDLFIRMLYQKHQVKFINNPLMYYRNHEGNISKNRYLILNAYKNISYDDDMLYVRLKQDGLNDKEVYNTLGIVRMAAEQYENAKELLLKANNQESEDMQEMIYTSFFLASSYYCCHEYDNCYQSLKTAQRYLNDIADIGDRLGILEYEAAICNNFGILDYHYGNYKQAEKLFERALSLNAQYIDASINKENICNGSKPSKYTIRFLRKLL